MNANLFLSTTGHIPARAKRNDDGGWSVDNCLEDQDVRCLACDPYDLNIFYVGTQGNGVLRSDDHGLNWSTTGLDCHIVKSISINPHKPGVIYAGTKPPGVIVSQNCGEDWVELESFRRIRGYRWWRSPAMPPNWRAYVIGLSLSPTHPNTIVAGIESGALVRTVDGGKTWSNHRKGALHDCHSLTFHAKAGNWVYEGGAGGAAVSQDGGETWQRPKCSYSC